MQVGLIIRHIMKTKWPPHLMYYVLDIYFSTKTYTLGFIKATCHFQTLTKIAGPSACGKGITKVQNQQVAKSWFVHLLLIKNFISQKLSCGSSYYNISTMNECRLLVFKILDTEMRVTWTFDTCRKHFLTQQFHLWTPLLSRTQYILWISLNTPSKA